MAFKKLFTSIGKPHLEYGACVWNTPKKNQIDLIENVQRRSSNLVPVMKDLSYKERLKLELPTMKYRRYRGDMIELYKISHRHYDASVSQGIIRFRDSEREYNIRGHKFSIFKERYFKNTGKFCFSGRTTDQWNNLPAEVVEADSINIFKNKLDKLWETNGIIYDSEIDIMAKTSARSIR